MIGIPCVIFALLAEKYQKKWAEEKERRDWERWEKCERMREKMGHTTDIVKIKRCTRPPRKKHRH